MLQNDVTPILLERAMEQLRQEREIFEQRKQQERRWFLLRLLMGYSSIILLGAVMAVAAIILINPNEYTVGVLTSAGAALFVDVLGLLVAVWKIVLNPSSITKLTAATKISLPDIPQQHTEPQPVVEPAASES